MSKVFFFLVLILFVSVQLVLAQNPTASPTPNPTTHRPTASPSTRKPTAIKTGKPSGQPTVMPTASPIPVKLIHYQAESAGIFIGIVIGLCMIVAAIHAVRELFFKGKQEAGAEFASIGVAGIGSVNRIGISSNCVIRIINSNVS